MELHCGAFLIDIKKKSLAVISEICENDEGLNPEFYENLYQSAGNIDLSVISIL
jgi:hypothetical protein